MKRIAPLLIGLFFALATALHAETMQMSRQQAYDLYAALNALESGLTPENTVTAGDDMIVLRPLAESLERGKLKAQIDIQKAMSTASKPGAVNEIVDAMTTKGDDSVSVELTRIELTLDEIKASKIKPKDLSVIRQWLKPLPPKKA